MLILNILQALENNALRSPMIAGVSRLQGFSLSTCEKLNNGSSENINGLPSSIWRWKIYLQLDAWLKLLIHHVRSTSATKLGAQKIQFRLLFITPDYNQIAREANLFRNPPRTSSQWLVLEINIDWNHVGTSLTTNVRRQVARHWEGKHLLLLVPPGETWLGSSDRSKFHNFNVFFMHQKAQ